MDLHDLPLVVVYWTDTMTIDGWLRPTDLDKALAQSCIMRSVGYVYRDTATEVVLVQSLNVAGDEVRSAIQIPRAVVEHIQPLAGATPTPTVYPEWEQKRKKLEALMRKAAEAPTLMATDEPYAVPERPRPARPGDYDSPNPVELEPQRQAVEDMIRRRQADEAPVPGPASQLPPDAKAEVVAAGDTDRVNGRVPDDVGPWWTADAAARGAV